MSKTVQILIIAYTSLLTEDLLVQVENSIKQSSCWVIEKLTVETGLTFRITAFADKLEKLYHNLQKVGLTLAEGSHEIVANASQQYSVFRDIEVTLQLNQLAVATENN